MTQVINDADAVRSFRERVEDARREVARTRSALERSLQDVRISWRDARAEAAEREVLEATEEMKRFERDADQTAQWLRELESRIRRYASGG